MNTEIDGTSSNLRQLVDLLTDPGHDRATRKLRLQGFRGGDLATACAVGPAMSLGPATCGVISGVIVLTGSALLAATLATTAALGVASSRHPVELLHNAIARHLDRPLIPPSRAAKRFACSLGATLLAGASVSYALGADGWGLGLALTMTIVPLFVAISGYCVPSVIFSLVLGTDAATAPTLSTIFDGRPMETTGPSTSENRRRMVDS